jgi:3-dehydroquinate synthase
LYEVAKHAILAGSSFFDQLEANLENLSPRDPGTLESVLERAVAVKIDVVSRDEREDGLRRVLNLGHTYGHAIEEATGYRRFMHGEAVGWGLLAVMRLARRLGLLASDQGTRIEQLIRSVGRLPSVREIDPGKLLELLPRDKKTVGGRLHWVIPERIGKVRIVTDVPRAMVRAAFREIQQLNH